MEATVNKANPPEKLEIRSKEWYDVQFTPDRIGGRYGDDVPANLRALSERFCDTYKISGTCDPMYVANIAALEFEIGSGCGDFSGAKLAPDTEAIDRFAKRIASSYSSSIYRSGSSENPEDVIRAVLRDLRPSARP
jgi:hypothetical protein